MISCGSREKKMEKGRQKKELIEKTQQPHHSSHPFTFPGHTASAEHL
jgi:hypothetical protein